MKAIRFLLKWWHRLWLPSVGSSGEIDVDKWAQQINKLNRLSGKHR
jgi:hypothetical protein